MIMIVPLLILRRLSMGRRQLYALAFLLSLGIMTLTAATVRFIILQKIQRTGRMTIALLDDIAAWSFGELTAVTVAACLPGIRAWYLRRRRVRCGSSNHHHCRYKSTQDVWSVVDSCNMPMVPGPRSTLQLGAAEPCDTCGQHSVETIP